MSVGASSIEAEAEEVDNQRKGRPSPNRDDAPTDLICTKLDGARALLLQARNAIDAKKIADVARAAEIYARRQKLGDEAILYAHGIKIEAMTLLGEFLKVAEKAKGARGQLNGDVPKGKKVVGGSKSEPPTKTLADIGISKKEASDGQFLADLKSKDSARYEDVMAGNIPLSNMRKAHVNRNSGEDEWYTPPRFIEAARATMGGIDLDPASSPFANKAVKAGHFFTKEDDGLQQRWHGRVWLNPPYSQPLMSQFAEKCREELKAERVKQLCVLVNNATDTAWFQDLVRCGSENRRIPVCHLCFTSGRVRFLDREGNPANTPLQGQAIIYFGSSSGLFIKHFRPLGFLAGIL